MISVSKIIGFLKKFHLLIKTECNSNVFIKADNPTLCHRDQQKPFRMTSLCACQPHKALQIAMAYEEDMTAMVLIWVSFCGAQTRDQEGLDVIFDLTVGLPISNALRFKIGKGETQREEITCSGFTPGFLLCLYHPESALK